MNYLSNIFPLYYFRSLLPFHKAPAIQLQMEDLLTLCIPQTN